MPDVNDAVQHNDACWMILAYNISSEQVYVKDKNTEALW